MRKRKPGSWTMENLAPGDTVHVKGEKGVILALSSPHKGVCQIKFKSGTRHVIVTDVAEWNPTYFGVKP